MIPRLCDFKIVSGEKQLHMSVSVDIEIGIIDAKWYRGNLAGFFFLFVFENGFGQYQHIYNMAKTLVSEIPKKIVILVSVKNIYIHNRYCIYIDILIYSICHVLA